MEMNPILPSRRHLARALGATALLLASVSLADFRRSDAVAAADPSFDPLLDGGPASVCGAPSGTASQQRAWLLALAPRTETAPFQPQPMRAAAGEVPLYGGLGTLHFPVTTRQPRAQAYFDQGLRLSFAFNHAEAERAFQAAQRLDPGCAACFWGEALVLGPNINMPMVPEANAPALAALAQRGGAEGRRLAARAGADRGACSSATPPIRRSSAAPLDAAYADAMREVAARFPADDTIRTLYAESAMDTQPWDYWQAGGAEPKGRGAEIVASLETVLRRNPNHPGAIHLYIHAVEASTTPERALAPCRAARPR